MKSERRIISLSNITRRFPRYLYIDFGYVSSNTRDNVQVKFIEVFL